MSSRIREAPVPSSSEPAPFKPNVIGSNDLSTPKPSAPPLDGSPTMSANIGFVDMRQEPITSQPAMQFVETRRQPVAKNYAAPDSYQNNYTQTQTQREHNNQSGSCNDCCEACLVCLTACECIVSCCQCFVLITECFK